MSGRFFFVLARPIALILCMVLPSTALSKGGDPDDYETESPQYGAFELKFGPYRPAVDENPSLSGTPYADIFHDDAMFLTVLELDWQFIHPPGFSVGLGGSIGFMQAYAKSLIDNGDGTTSRSDADYTVLNVIPWAVLAVFRVDALADYVNVPLVPFFKIGMNWYLWWTREGGQTGTIEWTDENGEPISEKARGATLGWQFSTGLAVRLDPFDRRTARTFDNDVGVNHSYLFVEFLWAFVNRFGNPDYMNLSTNTFANATVLGGLCLEF
jgi:hypothetical protein